MSYVVAHETHEKHSHSGVLVTSMRSPRVTTPPTSCRLRPPCKSPLCAHQTCLSAPPRVLAPPSIAIHCLLLYLLPILRPCSHSNRSPTSTRAPFRQQRQVSYGSDILDFYCSTLLVSSPPLPLDLMPGIIHPVPLRALRFPFICLVFLSSPLTPVLFLSPLLCSTLSGVFVVYISSRCPR